MTRSLYFNQIAVIAELIESAMYLWRATDDPFYQCVAVQVMTSIEKTAKTPCGYATVSWLSDGNGLHILHIY